MPDSQRVKRGNTRVIRNSKKNSGVVKNHTGKEIRKWNETTCVGCVTPCRRDMTPRRQQERAVVKWGRGVGKGGEYCQCCPCTKKNSQTHTIDTQGEDVGQEQIWGRAMFFFFDLVRDCPRTPT